MKRRWYWRWTFTTPAATWYGTCPRWALKSAQLAARGEGVLTVERVLTVGARLIPCPFPGCRDRHANLPHPSEGAYV